MSAKQSATASTSLSQDFIRNVRHLYDQALDQLVSGKVIRQGINGYTWHAAPAFVSAVAAIEAFLNEATLGPSSKLVLSDAPLWMLEKKWIQHLEIRQKLMLVPYLLFNQTFRRDAQPYQDLDTLVRIRNDVVHYKMSGARPPYLADLQARKIALRSPGPVDGLIWIHAISSSEAIRWANNTASRMVKALVDFMPEEERPHLMADLAVNFKEIAEEPAMARLAAAGKDPDADEP